MQELIADRVAEGLSNRYKGNEISIQTLSHGWTVRVGCVSFAVEEGKDRDLSIGRMLTKIEVYLIDPRKAEELYEKTGKY